MDICSWLESGEKGSTVRWETDGCATTDAVNVPVNVLLRWPDRSGGDLMTLKHILVFVKFEEWYRWLLCFGGDQGAFEVYICVYISMLKHKQPTKALSHGQRSLSHLLFSSTDCILTVQSMTLSQARSSLVVSICLTIRTSGSRDEAVTPHQVWLTSYTYSNNDADNSEEGISMVP
jgi:hypothetical protein